MKSGSKKVLGIFSRYLILVLIPLFGFGLFYAVFLPMTKFPVFWILSVFFDASLIGNSIFIGEKAIEIIGACVAGSAYSFLLILNLSTSGIKIGKRIKMILLSFLIFLLVNIIRIIVLGAMYINDSPFFDVAHKILWYAGSTVLVVLIWFYEVRIFKVNNMPVYADLKYFYKKSSLKKK